MQLLFSSHRPISNFFAKKTNPPLFTLSTPIEQHVFANEVDRAQKDTEILFQHDFKKQEKLAEQLVKRCNTNHLLMSKEAFN